MPATWHNQHIPDISQATIGTRSLRVFTARPRTLTQTLAEAVAIAPQDEALVAGTQRWNYVQLEQDVACFAGGLAARGVGKGDRVVLFLSNRAPFVVALYALARLGAIAVPVGVREQRPGLTYITRQCGASTILFDAELFNRIPGLDDVPALRLVISCGGRCDGTVEFGDILQAPRALEQGVAETDPAVILYTSGTTGHPKGAVISHSNMIHSVMHFETCLDLRRGERAVLAVPASHVTGLVAIVATMVRVAGAVILMETFKATDFIALAQREKMTYTVMVPAMYNLCLLQPDFSAGLSAWRVGGYGGAPMPVASIEALATLLPDLKLHNAYGATETTSPATIMPAGEGLAHADSVGAVVPCGDIRVVQADGSACAVNEAGELWIAGPMVVTGYWDNPQASAREFTDGYWHSGDIGSIDASGYVKVFDRAKDMLNRGGYKIYSVEVENVLLSKTGIIEAAIIGRPCPVLGERVHAVLYAPGMAHDDESIRAYCRARLADYKVPETLSWSDVPLPRNANGKLVKRTLRASLATT